MIAYQNSLEALEIPSTTFGYVQGILKTAADIEIARFSSYLANGKHTFYLDTFLRGAITMPFPDLKNRYIVHDGIIQNYKLIALGETTNIKLLPGIEASTPLLGTTYFNRITVDDIYPKTYYIENETQVILKAKYQGKIINLDTVDLSSTESFVTVNWHQYFSKFENWNTVQLLVMKTDGSILHNQPVHFTGDFTNYPVSLLFRNQYGFWDAIRCVGSYENKLNITSNNLETVEKVKNFFSEVYEKLEVSTGYISTQERLYFKHLFNYANEVWQYKDGELFDLIKETKDFSIFNSAESTDTAKLEFRYAQTKRIYL